MTTPTTSTSASPNLPIAAPPLVVIGVGDERLVETAELDDPIIDETSVVGVEAVNVLLGAVEEALDEAADPEDAGDDDETADVFVNDDAPAAEEVVAVADDVTPLLEDDGATLAEDEGGLLELPPALGTGATTPPCTVPPDCVEVPAALDL